MKKYKDDKFVKLEKDIDKIRIRSRQYISYNNEEGANAVVDEIIHNHLDECRKPWSPGNKINIEFDENTGIIRSEDNGRGIPLDLLEDTFTTLNMGSHIDIGGSSDKSQLKSASLGQNGTGTLAICGLGEYTEIISYRGGTEDKFKRLVFKEGIKVSEEDGSCLPSKHGLVIVYKPSLILGPTTKIPWDKVHHKLIDLQYLEKSKISISSTYTDLNGNTSVEKYKLLDFDNILMRNDKKSVISEFVSFMISKDKIIENLYGYNRERFMEMDIAFVYTNSLTPYIDSFSNSNNTVDNGDHLDGTIESICRYFQSSTKNTLTEKEKSSLDIKWEDVKNGLSIAVALRTDYESLYTGQTKHKIVNKEVRKIIQDLLSDALVKYFNNNPNKLKEICNIVKTNARIRRDGEKVKNSTIKEVINDWSMHTMKNFSPCINKGRAYKEIYLCEGLSAKSPLDNARDPQFQATFGFRGVTKNAYKWDIDETVGDEKGNREFNALVKVLGCNVGNKFSIDKLNYDKIIIATDMVCVGVKFL